MIVGILIQIIQNKKEKEDFSCFSSTLPQPSYNPFDEEVYKKNQDKAFNFTSPPRNNSNAKNPFAPVGTPQFKKKSNIFSVPADTAST
eukprot:UN03065